jgi:phage-related protein
MRSHSRKNSSRQALISASRRRSRRPGTDASLWKQALAVSYKILYKPAVNERVRPVEFRGSALDDLRDFPPAARREAGHQIDQIQQGRDPDDWKAMTAIGQGVREIRIQQDAGAFRVIYVAKFEDAVYVLHCFQKKTRKTRRADLDLAAKRYRDLMQELGR